MEGRPDHRCLGFHFRFAEDDLAKLSMEADVDYVDVDVDVVVVVAAHAFDFLPYRNHSQLDALQQ